MESIEDLLSILVLLGFISALVVLVRVCFKTRRRTVVTLVILAILFLSITIDDYLTPVQHGNLDILEIGGMSCVRLYSIERTRFISAPGYGCYPTELGARNE